jgi:pimeloyl-ACP methyl ester carboxylesterase
LLMWGDTDREVPLSDGERLHHSIPNARLIIFRACGHLPHEEYPESFVKLVTEFCATEEDLPIDADLRRSERESE